VEPERLALELRVVTQPQGAEDLVRIDEAAIVILTAPIAVVVLVPAAFVVVPVAVGVAVPIFLPHAARTCAVPP